MILWREDDLYRPPVIVRFARCPIESKLAILTFYGALAPLAITHYLQQSLRPCRFVHLATLSKQLLQPLGLSVAVPYGDPLSLAFRTLDKIMLIGIGFPVTPVTFITSLIIAQLRVLIKLRTCYTLVMHESQQRILDLANNNNLATMSLREIGEKTGIGTNPQLVRHHLQQLVKNGFLTIDRKTGQMTLASEKQDIKAALISIPIMGQANCGEALSFADDQIQGYLQVSPGLLKKRAKKPYVLKAVGESMNAAKIPTFGSQLAGIDDGDYVIVDGEDTIASNNEYIVAVIEGLANIKKLKQDEYGVRLISESRQPLPPIMISPEEQESFVSGKVLAVVKS